LGTLKIRSLDQPIHVPSKNDAVARVPREWLKNEVRTLSTVVR